MARRPNEIDHTYGPQEGLGHQGAPGGPYEPNLVKVLGVRDLLPVWGPRDRKIAMIAEQQRGRVARRQLLAAGIGESTIHRLVAIGYLHRLHAGVYAVGHLAPVELGRETAALLGCRDGTVLSHMTAALLWKLCAPTGREDAVDVTFSVGDRCRRPGIRAHRTTVLLPHDIRVYQRLPVTSPARTLLDIAGLLTTRELERALDEGLVVRQIVRVSQLMDVLRRGSTRAGAALLAELLRRRTSSTVTRSEGEERFLAVIRAGELPEPEVNVRLHGFLVDFVWREHRVVVEIDGYRFHSSRSAFDRDRRKDGVLKGAGWEVLRFSRDQVKYEPYAVLTRVVQTLTRAAARRAA